MSNWEKHRLIAQVQALRHLPPNTWLPELRQPDQDVLNRLLHLSDETDLLVWLEEKHSDLIARVLLWTVFDRLRLYLHGVHRAVQAGQTTIADQRQERIDELLTLPEVREQLRQLAGTHPITIDAESLYAGWQILRNSYQKIAIEAGKETTSDEIWRTALNELFRLPEGADPLQWIQDKRSHVAACETLGYILKQVRPPDLLWDGGTLQSYSPEVYLCPKKHHATLYEMALGPSAFVLTLRIRIPRELFTVYDMRSIIWEGIESVVDDLGYRYLVYRVQDGIAYRFWRRYVLMRLLCYPAIAATARRLTLISSMASFVICGSRSEEQYRRLKPIRFEYLGDLTWSMRLPK